MKRILIKNTSAAAALECPTGVAEMGGEATSPVASTFSAPAEELAANAATPPKDEIDTALESEEFAKLAGQIEADYSSQIAAILEGAKSYEEAFAAISAADLKSDKFNAAMQEALITASEQGRASAKDEQ